MNSTPQDSASSSPSPQRPFDRFEAARSRIQSLLWLPEILQVGGARMRKQARMLGLAMLVGVVAGLGAIVFHLSTQVVEHYALGELVGYRAVPRPAGESRSGWLVESDAPFRPWLLLIVPALGGLASGLLVFTVAPEAEGHGTDSVIASYHFRGGQLRPRVPLVKIIASSLTIGTGGSGGREGPIAQIGAGFGSFLANLMGLRTADRRVLMAAGMGSGIAAIFRAPLAGAMFAAEVLYRSPEFEPEVIIPTAIASVVSYCVYGLYSGWQPLFKIPNLHFTNPLELGPYLLLALAMVLLAMLYTRTFYGTTRLFHRWGVPRHIKPAVGALLTGALGLALYFLLGRQEIVLSVLAFGYNSLQQALSSDSMTAASVLLVIALGKILTTSLTIGSGGSGGVFGPSMVIGGCGGAALGMFLHSLWPELVPHPTSYALVGMAGFFAAAAKTPFSTIVIVSEMTGGYDLLLPSLWVCSLAFLLSDQQSIYSSQVESRSRSPAHLGSYVREVLADVRVDQFLGSLRPLPVLRVGDPLPSVITRMDEAGSSILPVVDGQGHCLGVVNLEEVHLASLAPALQPLIRVDDLMRSDIKPLTPQDRLDRALELFVENDLPALPIVDDPKQGKLLGMVRRSDIASAYLRHVQGPMPTN